MVLIFQVALLPSIDTGHCFIGVSLLVRKRCTIMLVEIWTWGMWLNLQNMYCSLSLSDVLWSRCLSLLHIGEWIMSVKPQKVFKDKCWYCILRILIWNTNLLCLSINDLTWKWTRWSCGLCDRDICERNGAFDFFVPPERQYPFVPTGAGGLLVYTMPNTKF